MIGQKTIEWNAQDMIKGLSSSDFINDGGFSSVCQASNIWKTPGLLYGAPPITDGTGDLTDDLIASSSYSNTNATPIRAFVGNEGNYYSTNATALVLKQTDSTNPTLYKKGFTDMVSYGVNGDIFTTNEKCVVQWNEGTTFDVTFFTFTTQTSVPHPALVFENNVYYGDKNLLHRQTAVGVVPTVVLELSPEQTIVTLAADPGTGRMLISTVEGLNASDTVNKIARVHYYDGLSNKPIKTIIVDEMITAFRPVGATLFIGYGQNLGYWNGGGIKFLRKLDVTLTQSQIPYKHNLTNFGHILCVVEGAKILAYGDIIGTAPSVFFYITTNLESGVETPMTMICNLGSGVLGCGWINSSTVEKFVTVDTSSVSSVGAAARFRTDKYTFPRPVTFNQVVIEYGAELPNNTAVGTVVLFDDTQTATILGTAQATTTGIYTLEFPYPSITSRSLQVSYAFTLQYPIRRISILYNDYD